MKNTNGAPVDAGERDPQCAIQGEVAMCHPLSIADAFDDVRCKVRPRCATRFPMRRGPVALSGEGLAV
jgi:hypothetical protein